jgi:hypothetical protein
VVSPMRVTVETPPKAAARPPRVRSSRWAWFLLLLSPVLCVAAIWMSFFVLGDEDIKWWGELIVMLMVFAPPVAAAVLGVRAGRSGNGLGTHAAAVAAASMAFVIMFWYLANYPYNGESGAMPLTLAVITAVLVAAATEGGWYWFRSRQHPTTHRPRAAR